jgi:peptide/nickel transport system substrate-binding protein
MFATGLSAAVVLAGCGDHATRQADRRPTASTPADPCLGNCTDPIARGPFTIQGAEQGGIVRVLTHDGLAGSLDPAAASEPDIVSLLSGLVTRSLTQYRYDPQTKQMELVPDLATDLGHHNLDYTTWEYQVRRGVRFEDGSPVTARDVARGVHRCLHGRGFATSPCLGNGLIRSVGMRGNTVTFHFARPFPDLPYLAAMPAIGPVPPGTTARNGAYAQHPTATGPYRIQQYRRGHGLVLVRNEQWDARSDPARTQYPDRYVVRAGLSERRIERLLLADKGSAQTTLTIDDVRPGPFDRSPTTGNRLVLGGKPCMTYLAPDNRTITDPRVRRALIWAYPYTAVLRAEGLVRGVTAVPATNLQPPGVPGRTSLLVPRHHGFETRPRTARRMLAAAHALGTPLRFPYDPHDRVSVRVRDALVRSLRASGFDPRPERAQAVGQAPAHAPADLRTTTRCGRWPSGTQWVDPVYRSTRPGRTGSLDANVEAFSRPAVDRRMDRLVREPLAKQYPDWNGLDRTILRRWQPVVPLWYAGVAMAHGSRIEGMADDPVHGMPTWGRIWVSGSS